MTWVRGTGVGPSEVDRVWDTRPEFHATYMALYNLVLDKGDPVVLELCRLRMATLIGSDFDRSLRYGPAVRAGLTEEKIRALPEWPSSPLYTSRERACIGFAEQFVIDTSSITDADTDAVLVHLSPDELSWFAMALSRFDGFQRCCAILDIRPGATVPRHMPGFVVAPPAHDGKEVV